MSKARSPESRVRRRATRQGPATNPVAAAGAAPSRRDGSPRLPGAANRGPELRLRKVTAVAYAAARDPLPRSDRGPSTVRKAMRWNLMP